MPIETVHRWHVHVWATSPRIVRLAFEKDGFRVEPWPYNANPATRFTVSHSSAAAVTLWILKYDWIAQHVSIEDI